MLVLKDTYSISEFLLPALINNDLGDLTKEELDKVLNFVGRFVEPYFEVVSEKFFARCEILGERSDCYEVEVYEWN